MNSNYVFDPFFFSNRPVALKISISRAVFYINFDGEIGTAFLSTCGTAHANTVIYCIICSGPDQMRSKIAAMYVWQSCVMLERNSAEISLIG